MIAPGCTVLIAGIGNVFLGDDGYGVEVVRRIDPAALPDHVGATDYGIRGVHLAYDLLDGNVETLIMVDALPTGETPGTVSLLEVDENALAELTRDAATLDSHSMNPEAVLSALHALGGRVQRVLVVGCEPATVDPGIGLSPVVAAAVDAGAELAVQTATEAVRQDRAEAGTR